MPVAKPFSKSNPCPVCGTGTKGCSVKDDGLHWCRGTAGPGWKRVKAGDPFSSYRRESDPPVRSRAPAARPARDWAAAAEANARALGAEQRAELAAALKLPAAALGALPLLGWSTGDKLGPCWTFPECDAGGAVVGLVRRFRSPVTIDGAERTKLSAAGGARGLTLPAGWRDRAGPVYAPEGASDVLALTHCGLAAVGRPSSTGGAELLAELVLDLPADRGVVVLGENDRKPDGRWPGREGAEATAQRLRGLLGQAVTVAYPPDGIKDALEWVAAIAAGWADAEDWEGAGQEIAAHLAGQAESPPPAAAAARVAVVVPPYTPFPVAALPPVLRSFVEEVAGAVGCDPVYTALPALTLAGAVAGAAVVVSPKRGYAEPPCVWACTVGDSGTGKSPGMRPVGALAYAIDRRMKDQHAAATRQYQADLEAWSASGAGPDRKPAKPVREYFAVSDATIERLCEMLGGSPRGLVLVRDELDGWFGSLTRYKSKGGTDVPIWLSIFEAGEVRVNRRTGEPRDVEADRGFIAVCGGIQPDVLRAALADPTRVASGFAARILFAYPPKACPRWTDVELDRSTEEAMARVLDQVRAVPYSPGTGPVVVKLDPAALARFKRLNDEFAERAEALDGGPMTAVLPKAVRYALRLALIDHLVRRAAAGLEPWGGLLTDESMEVGEVLAKWFVAEADRVYAMLAESPADRAARSLADLVRRKGGRATPRDLQRANCRAYPSAAVAELALDNLATAGLGEWVEIPPGPRGGQPTRVLVLHPCMTHDTTRHNPHPWGSVAHDTTHDTTPAPPARHRES